MINTIVFDLGGVLVDWNPLYLYRKIFNTEAEAQWFVKNICDLAWNEEQDEGRTIEQGEKALISQFPEQEDLIKMYYPRWDEMFNGPIEGTVEILKEINQSRRFKLLALTNWSAETFPNALRDFNFLNIFKGIIVSGEEKLRKPDKKIYKLLLNRYDLIADNTLFIDDNLRNINAAHEMGIRCIHFTSPRQLRGDLRFLKLID